MWSNGLKKLQFSIKNLNSTTQCENWQLMKHWNHHENLFACENYPGVLVDQLLPDAWTCNVPLKLSDDETRVPVGKRCTLRFELPLTNEKHPVTSLKAVCQLPSLRSWADSLSGLQENFFPASSLFVHSCSELIVVIGAEWLAGAGANGDKQTRQSNTCGCAVTSIRRLSGLAKRASQIQQAGRTSVTLNINNKGWWR